MPLKSESLLPRALAFLVLAGTVLAQQGPATGTPAFGSFGGGPFDVINLGNLNVHLAVPVIHKPGRGTDFVYNFGYDSSVWSPVTSGASQSWQYATNWGWKGVTESWEGYLTYTTFTGIPCYADGTYATFFTNWVYHDPLGNAHSFGNLQVWNDACGPQSAVGTTTDGSGYTINMSTTQGASSATATMWPRQGGKLSPPINSTSATGSHTDANGNQISFNGTSFTDTLGTTVLTLSGTAPNPVNYTYTSPAGTPASVVMSFKPYTVKTNFGCSGISEYGPTSVSLVDTIQLADGSKYSFQYEPTYGFTGDVTGRLKSVTLPTGGSITYTYSTDGTNGINCADGTPSTLVRDVSPGGDWKYVRSQVAGAHWKTTITAPDPGNPAGNQTVIDFQKDSATTNPTSNFYETQRLSYQGLATGTLLRTVITCYNGMSVATPANCPTTAVSSGISRKTVFTYYPDANGSIKETNTTYNGFGLVTEVDTYDFGNAAVGSLLGKTLISYATLTNGPVDRPSTVNVTDAAGASKGLVSYFYDEVSTTPTTGTPQHVAAPGARGNLTSMASMPNINWTLWRQFTYYDTGTPKSSTESGFSRAAPGASTNYVYGTGSCGNSFPTQINRPLNFSVSMTWNCTGGVQTSATDENGNPVSAAYTDQYLWRPSSISDQANAITNITYPSQPVTFTQTVAESSLLFNANLSVADVRSTIDGLGRPILNQILQGPNATNYDTLETDYDVAGRVSKTTLPFSSAAGATSSGAPGTTLSYDALGRVTQVSDSGGGSTAYSYTKNDVLQTVYENPVGQSPRKKQFEYDGFGRLTSVCELTAASGNGTCSQSSSQTGYWTKYSYDAAGRLLGVTQNAQAPGGSQQTRSYVYDQIGRNTSETNPETGNRTSTYFYDSLTSDAACGTVSSPGNLVKRVDAAGNVACYLYDSIHRLTSTTYPATNSVPTDNKYFVYDTATVSGATMSNAKGHLAEAYTCTGSCSAKITDLGFGYSVRGEVKDVYESTPHSGGYYHVTSQYWANGALNIMSGLPGLPQITYGADPEGRTSTVLAATGQNPVSATAYNVASEPTGVTFGSGDSDSLTFDPNSFRLTQYKFTVGSPAKLVTGNLTWNANSTVKTLAITDQFNAANTQTCNYTYDDLTRISSADCGSIWNQTFGFDPFGNISKSATVGTSFQASYSPTTNQITTIGSLQPSYDNNGNLINDTLRTYAWDAEGKMLSVDSTTVKLTFDALGRMIEQARGTTYTQIVYAPRGSKLALMNGQTIQKAFVQLPAGAQAVYTASGISYYRHTDWLGSSRFSSTPSTRQMYYDGAYAPYGENYAEAGTSDRSFTGQNQDTVSGTTPLHDFLLRGHSPIQGRWLSPDPAGLAAVNPSNPQSWNRYAYVVNNPLALIDPLGLCDDGSAPDENGNCQPDPCWPATCVNGGPAPGPDPGCIASCDPNPGQLPGAGGAGGGGAGSQSQQQLAKIIQQLQKCGSPAGNDLAQMQASGHIHINDPKMPSDAAGNTTTPLGALFGLQTPTIQIAGDVDPVTLVHEWIHKTQAYGNPLGSMAIGFNKIWALFTSDGEGPLDSQANRMAEKIVAQCKIQQ